MPDKQARSFFGLDGGEPWFAKYGKILWKAAVENPMTVVLLFGMWIVYVNLVAAGVRQTELETRREKWAERHTEIFLTSFGHLSTEIGRLRETVDRNTDAIRGHVFTPTKKGP